MLVRGAIVFERVDSPGSLDSVIGTQTWLSHEQRHVTIVKGLMSREKVAEVKLIVKETPENKVAWLMSMLERAVMPGKNKVDDQGDGL